MVPDLEIGVRADDTEYSRAVHDYLKRLADCSNTMAAREQKKLKCLRIIGDEHVRKDALAEAEDSNISSKWNEWSSCFMQPLSCFCDSVCDSLLSLTLSSLVLSDRNSLASLGRLRNLRALKN